MQKTGCLQSSITFNRFILLLCGIYLGMVLFIHNRLQTDHSNDKLKVDFNSRYPEENTRHFEELKSWVETQKGIKRLAKDIDRFQSEINRTKVRLDGMKKQKYFDEKCLKYGYEDLDKNSFKALQPDMYVYSAYLDNRKHDVYIRIMAIIDKSRKKTPVFCHTDSYTVQALQYEMCENHNKQYGGHIYSCYIPPNITLSCPLNISTQYARSTSEVTLPVIRTQLISNPTEFAICISPLFGNVQGEKLIEFIELSQVLGAQQFYFYDNSISDQMKEILQYYVKKQTVKIIPWQLPSTVNQNSIWYHGQLIAHNDCLYRTMATMKHVLFNDIDEYVIPHTAIRYWKDMFPYEFKDQYCGIAFSSAFFDPALFNPHPSGLQTMGITGRTKLLSHIRTKVLTRPNRIFEIGIHHISKQNEEKWTVLKYPAEKAYLHHYRKCIGNYGMRCAQYEKDETMLKYLDEVKDKYHNVLQVFNITLPPVTVIKPKSNIHVPTVQSMTKHF